MEGSLMAIAARRTELFALLATRKEERQVRLKERAAPQPAAGKESRFGPRDKDSFIVWKALEGAEEKDVVEMAFHSVIPRWVGIHWLADTEPWNLQYFAFASTTRGRLVEAAQHLMDLEEGMSEVDWVSILGDGGPMSAILSKVLAKYNDEIQEIKSEEEVAVAWHQQRMQEIQREKEVAQEGYGPLSDVLFVLKLTAEDLLGADLGSGECPEGEEEIAALYGADWADGLRMKSARKVMPDSDVWEDWKGFAVANGALEWRLSRKEREACQRWRQEGGEMPESMQAWNRLAGEWADWRDSQAYWQKHHEEKLLPSSMDAPPREVEEDIGSSITSMQKRHHYGRDGARKAPDTHIHNLPDDCLVNILGRLNTSDFLPSRISERVDVRHPLQCAVICKRWHALADTAVSKICLPLYSFKNRCSVDTQELVGRFKHLTALSLSAKVEELLPMGDSTLQLEHLELKLHFECPVPLMAQAFARWSNLRRLDLGRYLSKIADGEVERMLEAVGKLPTLEHLCFTYSGNSLVAVCTRVGAISGLTTVELESDQFPPLVGGRFMEVLRMLRLQNFQGARLPEYLHLFANLESFSVSGAEHLSALPESISRLSHLTDLQVHDCKCLTSLPDTLEHLSSLREITAGAMETWPASFNNLLALRKLTLDECEDFPYNCYGLTRLEHLVIIGGRAPAKSICSLCHISCLRVLELHDCDMLSVCLAGLGMLGELRELSITGCSTLNALPESLRLLTNLEKFSIEWFSQLRLLPEAVGEWRKLTKLEVSSCEKLQALPEGLGQIPLLKELRLVNCYCLAFLPSTAGCFSSLEVLDLFECTRLTGLPDATEGLGSLRRLRLSRCNALVLSEDLEQRRGLQIDGLRSR